MVAHADFASNDSGEFALRGMPALPATLEARAELRFGFVYVPTDVGADAATFVLSEASDAALTLTLQGSAVYAAELTDLFIQDAFIGLRTTFFLTFRPVDTNLDGNVEDDIELLLGGVVVGSGADTWSYDADRNAVVFPEASRPGDGTELRVTYFVACQR